MPDTKITKLNHKGDGDQLINQGGKFYSNTGKGQQFNAKTITAHFCSEKPCSDVAAALGWADPRDVKAGIEIQNGPLIPEACKWILAHDEFGKWRDGTGSQLLWIHGESGTGKTMVAISIINEMINWAKLSDDVDHRGAVVAYVFCEQTTAWINNPVAILRGLMCVLASQEPSIESIWDRCLEDSRTDQNSKNYTLAISALSNSLLDALIMIEKRVYLIIDGIDEIVGTGSSDLLGHIERIATVACDSRWIFSSRSSELVTNDPRLKGKFSRTDIELDKSSISRSLELYTNEKLLRLRSLDPDPALRSLIAEHIFKTAIKNGAFLWVQLTCLWFDLRCDELSNHAGLDHLALVRSAPSNINYLAVETLLKSGQQEYRQYKKNRNNQVRLENAIMLFKDATVAADAHGYKTGKVKALISRAECHRERSAIKGQMKFKMDQVQDAERILERAQELAADIQDQSLMQRVEFERALTAARGVMLEMRQFNPSDRGLREKFTREKDEVMGVLEAFKRRFSTIKGDEGQRGESITGDWMQALHREHQKWVGHMP